MLTKFLLTLTATIALTSCTDQPAPEKSEVDRVCEPDPQSLACLQARSIEQRQREAAEEMRKAGVVR